MKIGIIGRVWHRLYMKSRLIKRAKFSYDLTY